MCKFTKNVPKVLSVHFQAHYVRGKRLGVCPVATLNNTFHLWCQRGWKYQSAKVRTASHSTSTRPCMKKLRLAVRKILAHIYMNLDSANVASTGIKVLQHIYRGALVKIKHVSQLPGKFGHPHCCSSQQPQACCLQLLHTLVLPTSVSFCNVYTGLVMYLHNIWVDKATHTSVTLCRSSRQHLCKFSLPTLPESYYRILPSVRLTFFAFLDLRVGGAYILFLEFESQKVDVSYSGASYTR